MKWTRMANLNKKDKNEIWIRNSETKRSQYTVDVQFGKRTDLLKLKKNVVAKIEENFKFYHKSRTEFFSKVGNLEEVTICPACHTAATKAEFVAKVLEASYFQCGQCTHVYLKKIPRLSAIEEFYRTNTQYSQTYTDREAAEFRLNSVDMELADFMLSKFESVYQTKPTRVLDIGAGGGHFVEACRRKGMHAQGFEFSDSSVNFANEVWGIDLDQRDYVGAHEEYTDFDIVSFWGLLEHVPNPFEFIKAAARSVEKSKNGMIICRVPKWDSVSTVVQCVSRESIVRHLDPLGHIMIYTESSLCELFGKINYRPAAIWYYGMDSYEFLMQIGHATGNYDHLKSTSHLQLEVQQQLDNHYLSDLMVMVFVPNKN